ncbi:hypothetical protein CCZ01_08635, partial [Helicobacter monodelphidis]|uniref:HAMP domain-containing protein n=1 Tax=Helicobacter sp. 15-1451 TaxID=2004995 RepID=UPI000DCEBE92
MFSFYDNLKIGTKLVLTILIVVIIGIASLSVVVSSQVSSETQDKVRQNLVANVARYANYIEGTFLEMIALVDAVQTILINSMHGSSGYNAKEIEELLAVMDASNYINYMYVYLVDPDAEFKQVNPKYLTESQKFLIIVQDINPGENGGVVLKQAEDAIVNAEAVQRVLQSKKPALGEPKHFNIDGQSSFSANIAYPIFGKNDQVVGVVGALFDLTSVANLLSRPDLSVYEGDIRFVLTGNGAFAIHPDSSVWGKSFAQINTSDSAKEVTEAFNRKDPLYYSSDFIPLNQIPSYAIFKELKIGNLDTWYMAVTAPKHVVLQSLTQLQLAILVVSLVVLIFVAVATYLVVYRVISVRIGNLLHILTDFFKYLNHETKTAPVPLRPRANDEVGAMAKAINENIKQTQQGLEQDAKAVEQSIQTAQAIEAGNLTARITENPANPQLVELKNVLNQMLSVLQDKIGSDTNEISRVFNSYTSLDFTTEVKDAKGSVEIVTNTLGEEIRKMLHTSANFAKDLESKSKDLEEAVR